MVYSRVRICVDKKGIRRKASDLVQSSMISTNIGY